MMKNIKNFKVKKIDFSKILHSAVEDSQSNEGNFPSSLLFIASEEGQIITMREFGGLNPELLKTMYHLQTKLLNELFPIHMNDYLIDMIKIELSIEGETWCGFLGMIVNKQDAPQINTTSFLHGFQYTLQASVRYEMLRNSLTKTKQLEKENNLIVSILKEIDYKLHPKLLMSSCMQHFDTFFSNSQICSIFYQKLDDKYIPILATDEIVLEKVSLYTIKKEKVPTNMFVLNPIEEVKDGLFQNVSNYQSLLAFPIYDSQNNVFSMVVVLSKDFLFKENEINNFSSFFLSLTPIIVRAQNNEWNSDERRRKELLLQVTKKFHSSMNVGEILDEIIFALRQIYPDFEVNILLSHEWDVSEHLPVKQIQYGPNFSNGIAENVYLTGKIQIQDTIKGKSSTMYAPLRGKQGIYGVMEITAPFSVIFPAHEVEFIEMLADIGGNALENAELYQQSRELINDLQLINQTSHQLNSNLRLSETIKFMTNQIIQSFHAQEVGFIMFQQNGDLIILEGSTPFFELDSTISRLTELSKKIKQEKDAIYIGDTLFDKQQVTLSPYRSILAVPMIHGNELKGMVIVLHQTAYHFTFDNFKLLQSLIHHSTLAFTNSMLREELEKLVITDHLTRLYARNFLDICIQESMDTDQFGCFILIDIDNFKQINDTFGHQVGDDIIIQVANIMKRNIRENDIAARWGGEELAVYLPQVEPEVGFFVAERIVRSVANETSPKVTVSCGVSYWNTKDKGMSLKLLFNLADQGLYVAKETGKNQVIMQSSLNN